jgi:thioredoxin 1
MPTFLVFKSGTVSETIRGANPSALRTAVSRAASASGKASTATFKSKGYTLGSDSTPSRTVGGGGGASFLGGLGTGGAGGFADDAVRFMGLYLTTLFSFDGYAAAEASPFKIARR